MAASAHRNVLLTAVDPLMRPLLLQYSLPSFRHFAARHGYEVVVEAIDDDEDSEAARKRARWAKPGLMGGRLPIS